MDGISRSRGWDKEIPHCVLPMEQLVLGDKWARIPGSRLLISSLPGSALRKLVESLGLAMSTSVLKA